MIYAKQVILNKFREDSDMNTMTYKGYIGSVNYSDKDQVFFGKI